MANLTAEVVDKGAWATADEYGKTDTDPSTINNGCMHIRYTDTSAAFLSLVSTTIAGAQRISVPATENGIFDLLVPISWVLADNAFYVRIIEAISLLEAADTTKAVPVRPIVGAKVTIGVKEAITDSQGYAKFEGLSAGTYPIKVDAPNYMYNVTGIGTDKPVDTDTFNDTITVPPSSNKKYQLLAATNTVEIIGKQRVKRS